MKGRLMGSIDGVRVRGPAQGCLAPWLQASALAAGLLGVPVLAHGDSFPAKPLRMVVPFAPGGISDVLARTVAQPMARTLGQAIVIDNRAGASGNIGTELVARAGGDGYTLLFVAPAFATNVSLFSRPGYDPVRDFKAVAQVASATNLLVAVPSIEVRSVKQLIEHARSRPGALNYGSGGAGTSGQLAAELFQLAAHVKMTHVAYKGAGPALAALLGNEVQIMFAPVTMVVAHVSGSKLHALAVTGAHRSRSLPDVATIAEAAIPGFDVTSWFGIVAPAATPDPVIGLLHASVTRAVGAPDFADRLAEQGAEPVSTSAAAFGAYIKSEVARWAKVIKAAGLRAN